MEQLKRNLFFSLRFISTFLYISSLWLYIQGTYPSMQSESKRQELCEIDWDLLGQGYFDNISSKDLSCCRDALVLSPRPCALLLMYTDTNPISLSIKIWNTRHDTISTWKNFSLNKKQPQNIRTQNSQIWKMRFFQNTYMKGHFIGKWSHVFLYLKILS